MTSMQTDTQPNTQSYYEKYCPSYDANPGRAPVKERSRRLIRLASNSSNVVA